MKKLYINFVFLLLSISVFASEEHPTKINSFNLEDTILTWETSLEVDNNKFVVEASTDKINWSTIGEIKGQFYSSIHREYNLPITAPNTTTYYRIKQIDLDGDVIVYNKITTYSVAKEEPFVDYEIIDQKISIHTNDGNVSIMVLKADGTPEIKLSNLKDHSEINLLTGIHFIKLKSEHEQLFEQIIIK
ncbi:hypothetical protein [Flammeovirga kamogawensis]|uniref:T9SS type A sorting domain-containing protein n=1 Tax=Flammeovirga kamogawensis TaxID=373891 RepID=A0ABX8H0R0_9BACT|nr:hypothetical protein [Flammeovirga kamogawensis]MBB6462183.1 hypothetical protein [Flammeovirga kamogawensis]QWG09416.1 hypothetical protein KM029_22680 [Flammeovirga kamogawensis]TRX64934.1 hypothetical protein EO216_20590 [Flammeovirga kamogawensis]